ncbi:hypothetical protein N7472_005606 [Penicillium cf. griseofulvum]|uniref:Uncharacterized protein n=1 Tax=Penicillium cf. griseofulvum TaxID=2972120 RepID=A0A9W9JQ57_9EURO|nr:hypothetical protein N7472_005606 [Penicillium cf. griseofulvum]
MEVPAIYAIAAGSIFLALFLIQTRYILVDWIESFSVLLSGYLTLPVLVCRYRILGLWTRASILVYISYIAVNIALVFLRTESLVDSGRRPPTLVSWPDCLEFPSVLAPLLYYYSTLSPNFKLCFLFYTFVVGLIKSFSEAIRYLPDFLSIVPSSIFLPTLARRDWLITFLELAIYLYRNGIFSGRSAPRALILFLNLVRYGSLPIDSSVLFLALFTGPYRLTEDVDPYETTLIIATGFRIATSIPYIKKIIHSYNIYTSYTRRLYLVCISIYVEYGLANSRTLGLPDYRKIISTEVSGSQIKRLPNIPDELGRTLFPQAMVSEIAYATLQEAIFTRALSFQSWNISLSRKTTRIITNFSGRPMDVR